MVDYTLRSLKLELDEAKSNNDEKKVQELEQKMKRELQWGGFEYNPELSPLEEEIETIDNIEDNGGNEYEGDSSTELDNITTYPHEAINSIGNALDTWNQLYEKMSIKIANYKVQLQIEMDEQEKKILAETNGGNKVSDEGIITSEVYEEILKDAAKSKVLYRVKSSWDEHAASKEGLLEAELIEPMYFIKRDLVNGFKLIDDIYTKNYDTNLSIKENDINKVNELNILIDGINEGTYTDSAIKAYSSDSNKLECVSNVCYTQKNFADNLNTLMTIYKDRLDEDDNVSTSLNIDSNISSVLIDKGFDSTLDEVLKYREKISMFFDKDIKNDTYKQASDSISLYIDVLIDIIEDIRLKQEYGEEDEALIEGMYSAVKEKDEAMFEIIGNTRMTGVLMEDLFAMLFKKDKTRKQLR